jgi:hypothetical protein
MDVDVDVELIEVSTNLEEKNLREIPVRILLISGCGYGPSTQKCTNHSTGCADAKANCLEHGQCHILSVSQISQVVSLGLGLIGTLLDNLALVFAESSKQSKGFPRCVYLVFSDKIDASIGGRSWSM